MIKKKPVTLRCFCGVLIAFLLLTFAVSLADEVGLLPDFMVTDGNPQLVIVVVAANVLSQLHWQRIVPNPAPHWTRLMPLVVFHVLPFYVGTTFVVHLIFKLT